MNLERIEEARADRNKYEARWEKANDVIFEFGNFCIKIIITLNSTAILASVAFVGSLSSNFNPTVEAVSVSKALPTSLLMWAGSLTLILLATFFTYICHRWMPSIINLWHKKEFIDVYIPPTTDRNVL